MQNGRSKKSPEGVKGIDSNRRAFSTMGGTVGGVVGGAVAVMGGAMGGATRAIIASSPAARVTPKGKKHFESEM